MKAIQLIFGTTKDEKAGQTSLEMGSIWKMLISSKQPKFLERMDPQVAGKIFLDYKSKFEDGAEAARQFAIDNERAAYGIGEFLRSTDAAGATYANYTQYIAKANAATQKFSLSTKLASVGMKALSMAGNMAIMMAVSFAVQKAFEGIDWILNRVAKDKEHIQNLESAFSDLQSEVKDVESELEKVSKRMDELKSKGPLTLLEKSELSGLMSTSKGLELQLAALKSMETIKAKEVVDAKTKLFGDRFGGADISNSNVAQLTKNELLGLNNVGGYPLAEQLRTLGADNIAAQLAAHRVAVEEISSATDTVYRKAGEDLKNSIEKGLWERETDILDLIKTVEAIPEKDRSGEQIQALELANVLRDAIWQQINPDAYADINFRDIFNAEKFDAQKTKLIELAKAGELTAAALSAPMFDGILAEMQNFGIGVEQVITQVSSAYEKIQSDEALSGTPSAFAESLTKLQEKLDLLKSAQEESAESGSVSFETYQKLAEAGSEYAAVIDEVNGKLVINADRARELEDTKLTKIKDDVESALEPKQAEYDEVTKQLDDMQASYMRMWETATDKRYLDAQRAQIDILKEKQAQIANEINGYKSVVGQINAATSAYQRYLQSKNAPEQGDKYDQFKEAKKDIKEALDSGKVGTDAYKDAVEMMLGEGALAGKTTKEKKALGREAKQKYDRYFTDSEKGAQNYVNDLVKKGLATRDGNHVELKDGVKAEDIAREFGMSVDAIEAAFGELEEYDWNVNWEGLFPPGTAAYERGKKDRKNYENGWNDGAGDQDTPTPKEPGLPTGQKRADEADERAWKARGSHTPTKKSTPTPEVQGPPKPNESDLTSQIENLKAELSGLVKTYNQLSGLSVTVTFTPETAPADITAIREAILALSQGDNNVTGSVEFTGADDANATLATYTGHLETLVKNYKDGKIPTQVFFSMAADFQANIDAANEYLASIPETVNTTATVDAEPGETLTVSDLVKDAEDGKVQIDVIPHIKEPVGYVPENDYGGNPPAGSGLPSDIEGFSGYTPPAPEETVTINTETGETVAPGELVEGVDSNWNTRIQAHAGATRLLPPEELVSGLVNGELPIKVKPEVSGQVTIPTPGSTTGPAKAKGDKRTKDGLALVDDGKGSNAGAELIEHVSDGTWELGDGSRERFAEVKAGDIVHNAQDTRKIFKRAAAYKGVFTGSAFASGTDGDFPGGNTGGGKTPNKNNSKKPGNWKKYVKDLFDWIEIRIAALQRVTDNWTKSIQHTVGYIAKNLKIDLAIKSVQAQIDAAQKGHAKYMELLATLRGKMKLSPDMIAQIEDGSIDVSKLKPKMRAMVEEYMKWHDKANELQDSLADLEAQQRDLAKQKLDSIAQDYGFRVDRIDAQIANAEAKRNSKIATGQEMTDDDYVADIAANNQKLKVLSEQRAAMQQELNNLVASGMIQQGSEDWHNYIGQIEDLDVALLDAKASLGEIQKAIYDLKIDKLNYALDSLKHAQETSESLIDNKIASGKKVDAADYLPMLAISDQQIANLQEQIALAIETQRGLDKNSELFQELESNIRSNESAIWDARKAQIEWNDAIKELPLQNLRWANDALQAIKSSIEGLRSLNEAQKIDVDEEYYQSLVALGMDEITNLENQNQLLRERIIGLDIESEKYQEIKSQIEANEQAILGVKAAQEEWLDGLIDIKIDAIQKLQDELEKTNDKYERRIELEKALENLEKARQRTKLVYKEGQGFVYQRDEKAVKDAEKALKDVQHKEHMAKLEDLKDALEESKKDNNIYDRDGNLLTPIDWTTMGIDLDAFQKSLMDSIQLDGYGSRMFEDMVKNISTNYNSVDNSRNQSLANNFYGGIQIYEAQDANAFWRELYQQAKVSAPVVTARMLHRRP